MLGDALPHPLSLALALRPDLERLTSCTFDLDGAARCRRLRAALAGERGPLLAPGGDFGRDLGARARPGTPWTGSGSTAVCASGTTRSSCAMGPGWWTSPIRLRERLGAFLEEVGRAEAAGRPARELDPRPGRAAGLLEAIDAAFPGQSSSAL